MSEQWYYAQRGQQLGPVPTEVLTAMAAEGQLHPGDLVWKEGMANWVPAHSVPGLFAAPARPVRSAAEGYDVLPEAERPAPSYPEPEEEPEDYRPRRRPPPRGNGVVVGIAVGVGALVVIGIIVLLIVFLQGGTERSFSIRAGEKKVFNIHLKGGVKTEIWVTSEKNTDIDIFVFDPNNMKVAEDIRFDKDCYVQFVPRQTGSYRVEVVNVNLGGRLPVGPNHCTLKWSQPE